MALGNDQLLHFGRIYSPPAYIGDHRYCGAPGVRQARTTCRLKEPPREKQWFRAADKVLCVPSGLISLGHQIKPLAGTARAAIREETAGIRGGHVSTCQPDRICQIILIADPIMAV